MYEEITNTPPAIPKCHACKQPLSEVEVEKWGVVITPYEIDHLGQLIQHAPWNDMDPGRNHERLYHKPCSSLLNTAEVIWFTDMMQKRSAGNV